MTFGAIAITAMPFEQISLAQGANITVAKSNNITHEFVHIIPPKKVTKKDARCVFFDVG